MAPFIAHGASSPRRATGVSIVMALDRNQKGLRATTTAMEGAVLLRLEGRIDETFSTPPSVAGPEDVLVLDLDGVHSITSFGVRHWVTFLAQLKCKYIAFIHCRPAMVTQFNSVAGFAGRGELLSLYTPYICPKCEHTEETLIDVRASIAEIRTFKVPPHRCSACTESSELDDIPEEFFYYVAQAPQPNPPPLVAAILRDPSAAVRQPFRLNKDITEEVTALWMTGTVTRGTQLKRVVEGLDGTAVVVVCSGLDVNETDVGRLRPVLDLATSLVFLARAPPRLLQAIAHDPKAFGQARVTSVMMAATCPSCQKPCTIECSAAQLQQQDFSGACPQCERRVTADEIPAEVLKTLAAMPVESSPPAVASYLARNRSAPEVRPGVQPSGGRKYVVERRLGFGGMAEVFQAVQVGEGGFEKQVVLKRILPNLAASHQFVEMFLSEARLAARINHRNVVQIFDVDRDDVGYLIAMEWVDGIDLNVALKTARASQRPFPPHIALRITVDICQGLHAAHSVTSPGGEPAPIIHRDVSPHNVLLSAKGVAKLSDFGIAKAAGANTGTPVDMLKGKVAYLSPEQLLGKRDASVQSDIFAVGIVMYSCLTLQHPFDKRTESGMSSTVAAILKGAYVPVGDVRAELSPVLDAILQKALAASPDDRYASADELSEAISKAADGMGGIASEKDLAAWVLEMAELASTRGVTVSDDDPGQHTPTMIVENKSDGGGTS